MKLYRVTFQTSVLVECKDAQEAEQIGRKFLGVEVDNGGAGVLLFEELRKRSDLMSSEVGSLPWRSHDRCSDPEVKIEELLAEG